MRRTQLSPPPQASVAVIGGGPAGLMAAEQLLQAGISVDLFDANPSLGRKFLIAGKGGLNITHSEAFDAFCARYREREAELRPMLEEFGATQVREWCQALGVETFVGTSGRVFPKELKAGPLLHNWIHRLKPRGLQVYPSHRWLGFAADGALRFAHDDQEISLSYRATILALGGASWPKLGSDGSWVDILAHQGISISPLRPANCGFLCDWSEFLRQRIAGLPVKSVSLTFSDEAGTAETRKGELMLTPEGIEGGLLYAFSAPLRECILAHGTATIFLDLSPDRAESDIVAQLQARRKKTKLSAFLKKNLNLGEIKTWLLYERASKEQLADPQQLAHLLKALPIVLTGTTPLADAISTAGGVRFSALNEDLMLHALPGVFCAGEMLDWEAPTGGYLLTACFATGKRAGEGALRWLQRQ